jgi:hypothetical protein
MNALRAAKAALIQKNAKKIADSLGEDGSPGLVILDQIKRPWAYAPKKDYDTFYTYDDAKIPKDARVARMVYYPDRASVKVKLLNVPINLETMRVNVDITDEQRELIRVGDLVASGELSPFSPSVARVKVSENWSRRSGPWNDFCEKWCQNQVARMESGHVDPAMYTEDERLRITHQALYDKRYDDSGNGVIMREFRTWKDENYSGLYGPRGKAATVEELYPKWNEWQRKWDEKHPRVKRKAESISARIMYV